MKTPYLKLLVIGLPALAVSAFSAHADDTNELGVSVTPAARSGTVKGDEQKFREDGWIKEGWAGGVEDATFQHNLGADWLMNFEGRAIFDEEDYKLRLEIVNPKVGFVRAGFTEFRTYYDATGGFFRGFTVPSFDLNRDLFLRNGDIFIEAGLTLPNLPKLTLGYERQFLDGSKSLLEWGGVTQGTTTRKIFPSLKDVDQHVDIFKAEIEHDVSIIHLGDQFRYEHFRDDTTRFDTSLNLDTSARKTVTVHQDYKHDAFYNTFRLDSHVTEKVYWSLGYLYTTLNGDAGLAVQTPPPLGPFDKNWLTRAVDLDTDSHVLNLNMMFGPFAGLSVYGGLQAEKTDSHGFTDALLTEGLSPPTTNLINGTNNKRSLEETAGLRFTKIPYTTLYAEGKWTQQDIDLAERATINGSPDFARDTDTEVSRRDYSVGFNTAPLPRMTLAGRYRHAIYNNDYNHEADTELGYPAFITAQDFTTDEVMGKLTLRPWSRLSMSFKYQLVATDIRTATEAVPAVTPGGSLKSGDYDSSIYSVSATVTPTSRLYLTGLFSFQDTRTRNPDDTNPALQTYRGNVYTLIGTAGFALDPKTDLTVEYIYSRTDNFKDNSASGLPLGLDNQRQGVIVGISRRVTNNVLARARYGWYEYDESSNGGIDNYRAQLASLSCTVRF